jgi:molybdopterin-guanine dinucleotide biosynthesis protein A
MTGLPFIFDLYLGRGPLGGLYSSLASAETKWAFVLACDYPFVSAELIEFIKQQISDEYETIIPVQQDGRLQPLCGFYRDQPWLSILQEILDRPRISPPLYQLCEDANSRRLTYAEYSWIPNSENLFLNINTKEDLDKAVELEHKLLSEKVI